MDISKLNEGLEKLTGIDFESAEKRVRTVGDTTPIIQLSVKFQLELAAIALGTNANEIKALPIRKFNQILSRTQNFLYDFSDENETASGK